jgi:tetratricopeptide (TPR) repeat protein
MYRTRLISLPIVFAIFCAGFPNLAWAEKKEPNPWLQINSAHFVVITDAGDKKGREVALRFEQMRAVFSSILNKDQLNQPVPLTILAFKSDESYYKIAPLHNNQPVDVPGFFLPGEDQDFIALNLMEPEPWRAVAGDLARMLLDDNYPPAQLWFDDGLADYFSSIRVDDQQVQIGGDPVLARATNKNNGNATVTDSPKSFTEILNTQPWIPIPELFATKAPSTNGGDSSLFQAESWMVMHYLIHEKKLSNTGTYLGLVYVQSVPVADAIEKAYGMPAAQLEQGVKDYFHSLTALQTAVQSGGNGAQPYQYASLVKPDDSAIISKPLPELDAHATSAEVQIRIPERRDMGLQALKTLATTPTPAEIKAEARKEEKKQYTGVDSDPDVLPTAAMGDELAHRVLAWDDIQHNDFEEALGELSNAAAIDQRDMWIRYYLCQLKYRMAQATKKEIQGLANMLIDLRSVLEWYPQMSSAYDLMALGRNEGGTTTEAMQAERAAMSLSPRNELYVYHMAQIYIAAKKWDAAQALLERLKTGNNPRLVQLAKERLDEIGNQRKYGMAVANGPQEQLAPQKSPFDVLNQDAAQRAAQEKQQQTTDQADTRPAKFVKGRLIAVDCAEPPIAILTISAHGSILKLRAADYKSLLLIGADEFSCDWHDRQVDANYKPGGQSDGDLVSLEIH